MGRTKTISDDDVLRHAREIFRAGGHAASTRDVARAAGISQAVLYQRFGSKEDLFARAMTPDPPDLVELLGPYPPRGARADLKRIAERLTDYLASLVPTLLHVLAHPGFGHEQLIRWHTQLPFHHLLEGLTERFRQLREDGLIGRADPASAAKAFLASVHAAAVVQAFAYPNGHQAPARPMDGVLAVLWHGLAPMPTEK